MARYSLVSQLLLVGLIVGGLKGELMEEHRHEDKGEERRSRQPIHRLPKDGDATWHPSYLGCSLSEEHTRLTCRGEKVRRIPKKYRRWTRIIREIVIDRTSVTHIHNKAFENYASLELVNLTNNKLDYIHKSAFYWLNLKSLHLRNNGLKQFPKLSTDVTLVRESCNFPKTLIHLDVGYNNISSLDFIKDCDMPNLETLNVDRNNISHVEEGALGNLASLRTFTASGMRTRLMVTDGAFNDDLKMLDLSGNRDISLPPSTLTNLHSLYDMSLADCGFTTLYEDPFLSKGNLTKLAIHDNPFVCNCSISWIVKAINEDRPWARGWKMGSSPKPTCGSPDWLPDVYKDITKLYREDLCEKPDIEAIDNTPYTRGMTIILQARMMNGFPTSTWLFPDGRIVKGRRYFNGDVLATEVISPSNHSVMATLRVDKDLDITGRVYFILTATNAAGNTNLTFPVTGSMPAICKRLCQTCKRP